MQRRHAIGLTSLELVIITGLLCVTMGILLQVLRTAHQRARMQYDLAALHGLHTACGDYAATNKGWFPGLMSNGQYPITPFIGHAHYSDTPITDANTGDGATVNRTNGYALAVLLENGGINPAALVSSGETGATTHPEPLAITPATPNTRSPRAGPGNGEVTHRNLSYALLQYAVPELKPEWRADAHPRALIAGSRLIFCAGADAPRPGRFNSIWTAPGSGRWQGSWISGDGASTLDSFNAAEAASATETPFANLRYGAAEFTPLQSDAGAVGPFGKSGTGMLHFGATAGEGQLGSAND